MMRLRTLNDCALSGRVHVQAVGLENYVLVVIIQIKEYIHTLPMLRHNVKNGTLIA